MVDRVGDQVTECVGNPVEHAGVELDVLTFEDQRDFLARGCGYLSYELGERRHHATYGDHGQTHGAVTDPRQPALGVLDPAA